MAPPFQQEHPARSCASALGITRPEVAVGLITVPLSRPLKKIIQTDFVSLIIIPEHILQNDPSSFKTKQLKKKKNISFHQVFDLSLHHPKKTYNQFLKNI
jgi:hypothetical protein